MGKRTMWWALVLVGAFSAGCGGSDSAAANDETNGGEAIDPHNTQHQGDEHEYADLPDMAPALEEFHYAFSQHWHGDRTANAVCPDAGRLQSLASAAADEHGEPSQSDELRASTQAVADACADPSHAEYAAAFDRMHHALHAMMGAPLE